MSDPTQQLAMLDRMLAESEQAHDDTARGFRIYQERAEAQLAEKDETIAGLHDVIAAAHAQLDPAMDPALTARLERYTVDCQHAACRERAELESAVGWHECEGINYERRIAELESQCAALRAALEELRIDANRLCDRCQGGSYEADCRRSIAKADAALAQPGADA